MDSSLRHSAEHLTGITPQHLVSATDSSNHSCRITRYGSMESSELERLLDPTTLSARVRTCDVFLGFCGRTPSLRRFVKWLRAELEMLGVSCFVRDRRRCRDAHAHAMARAAMDAAAFGVIVLTRRSFSNPYCVEEMRLFSERRNLVPVFFGVSKCECNVRDVVEKRGEVWERYGGKLWLAYGGLEEEWKWSVGGLSRTDVEFEVHADNFRDCILDTIALLGTRLGRRSVVEKVRSWRASTEEFPFPRNNNFVGRKKELIELELLLFGDVKGAGKDEFIEIKTYRRSRQDRTAGRGSRAKGIAIREREEKQYTEKSKGKETMVWKESEEEIEMHGVPLEDMSRQVAIDVQTAKHGRKISATELLYGKGIACVSGESGIGKTEIVLEYAYRFSQMYKRILWVGGEARYFRQNYLKLLPSLGVDVSEEDDCCLEGNVHSSFEDIEKEAIRRVRKELMRDIPFLLVIDNLESEKDWWDGKNLMELLPRFGGETHVIISTRLPRIMNIVPLRLLYLSHAEALSMMKGTMTDLRNEEVEALTQIEDRLGRLPLGLAIAGAILHEHSINPHKLLDSINKIPYRELAWSGKEDLVLKHNPFLVQLLDFCFSIFYHAEKPGKLAIRMVQASGWFAPAPIPISMLALAASESPREHEGPHFWRKCVHMVSCMCMASSAETPGAEKEATSMLIRFRVARTSTKPGCISFHNVIKLYARRRGNGAVAQSMVTAVRTLGSIPHNLEHIWAACFLLFKFGSDPVAVNLSVPDLLSFIRNFVLPIARHSFSALSQCNAALDLLRHSSEALEVLEESFLSKVRNGQCNPSCLMSPPVRSNLQFNPLLYKDFAHLRATLLEMRARLMFVGGLSDIGEQLCRTAISIKEVMYGWEHPEILSARETMERIRRFQSNY